MTKRRSKLSIYKQNKLLELFVGGVTARTAAKLAGINRHSATLYYQKIRAMIAQEIEDETPFDGEIEVDESYFCSATDGLSTHDRWFENFPIS
jgi:transposase